MVEYNTFDKIRIDRIIIRNNDSRLEKGLTTASLYYLAEVRPNIYQNRIDELSGIDVEKALKKFMFQERKSLDELKREGKVYVHDIEKEERLARQAYKKEQRELKKATWKPRESEFDKARKVDNKRKKKITIISIGVAAILGLSGLGYTLLSKPQAPVDNNKILYNMDNNLAQYITVKAQVLYKGAQQKNSSNSYNRKEAYQYCMYVSNLFMGGDDIGYDPGVNEAIMGSVSKVVKDSVISSYEDNPTIVHLAESYDASRNRIAYSATPPESLVFKSLPPETQKAIILQFMRVAEAIHFEFNPSYNDYIKSDYPTWWIKRNPEDCYNYEKLMEAANRYVNNIEEYQRSASR